MLETIKAMRPQDVLDILLVSYLIYRIILLLRGTRAVLYDGERLPHWHAVRLTITAPILPQRTDDAFAAAVQLRDAARAAMQQHLNASETATAQRRAPRLASMFHHHAPHP